MEISRRKFFSLAGGATAAIALSTVPAASVSKLVEDKRGAWTFADGSWLDPEEFPELFDVIGHTYGLPRQPSSLFPLPDFMARVMDPWHHHGPCHPNWCSEARVVREFNHIIKVRPGGDDNIPVGTILAYVGSVPPV